MLALTLPSESRLDQRSNLDKRIVGKETIFLIYHKRFLRIVGDMEGFYFFRNSLGVKPKCFLNVRVKC